MGLGLRQLFSLLLRRNVHPSLKVFQRYIEAAGGVFAHAGSLAAQGSCVETGRQVCLVTAPDGQAQGQGGAGVIT